jgi:hypothetical protein
MLELATLPTLPAALPLAATALLWYSLPLMVSVSLVCAATRHELLRPILDHAVRFGVWVLVFMGLFVALISLLQWLI